jgi:hypothetical protein
MSSSMVANLGNTEEYWHRRDIGPLPDNYRTTQIQALARDECCDFYRGRCVRLGAGCILPQGRRCSWFECAVLPHDDECTQELAAEYANALKGIVVRQGGVTAAKRVRMALQDLADERPAVTACDVIRYSQLPANTVRKHIAAEARTLGLQRRGKGRGVRYMTPKNVPTPRKTAEDPRGAE